MADYEPWLDRLELPWPTYEGAHYEPEPTSVYVAVMDVLHAERVPYLLAGAFALNVHTGVWRSTKDLDFFLRPSDLDAAFTALEGGGFRVEVVDPVWLSKGWREHIFVDIIHCNANGLMPVDDTWFEHAAATTFFNREVLVAPAEEVILSKMFVASRERYDGADVLHLLYAAEGRLDWDRLLAKAAEHAGLLLGYFHHFQYAYPAFAHYVPAEVIAAAERQAAEARLSDAFRGRLIDPIQFSVDVDCFRLPDERARVRAAAGRRPTIEAARRRWPDAPPRERAPPAPPRDLLRNGRRKPPRSPPTPRPRAGTGDKEA
jgi:hypothetical protein